MDEIYRTYDLTTLLDREDSSVVHKLVEKHGGVIRESHPVTKLTLAYPIKKQISAYAACFLFSIDPSSLSAFERDLKIEPYLLRFLLLRATEAEKEEVTISSEETKQSPPVPYHEIEKEKEAFLTNEAIEKKIKEILK